MTTKDLLLKAETTCETILQFRNLSNENKINIDYNDAKTYALGIALKFINSYDYSYNKHCTLRHYFNSYQKIKKKYSQDAMIFPIFPTEYINTFYLNKKQYKLATKLPNLLITFERLLQPYQLITDFDLKVDFKYEEIKYFLWAITPLSFSEDYNFESLETLGDSIIKFILSLNLFQMINDAGEGKLVYERMKLLKNDNLYKIGDNSNIFNYIFNLPVKVSEWEPPLIRNFPLTHSQSITKKCLADAVEALIGACFLSKNGLNLSFEIMQKFKIISLNAKLISYCQSKIKDINRTILIKKDMLKEDIKEDISFIELYNFFNKKNKINFLNDEIIQFQISESYPKLEEIISYNFKKKNLIIAAFTHSSFDLDLERNYERLEFLGDSILEIYIIMNLFNLLEDQIESFDKDFNCGNLTHAKSLLTSNNFLIKISILLDFHKFIAIKDTNTIEKISEYMNTSNIKPILNQKMNKFDEEDFQRPKVISDVFEATLGAILIDSNLEECFKFLNKIYTPFLIYTAKYFNKIMYSPVSTFTEICTKELKITPIFIKKISNDKVTVEIKINGEVISQGEAKDEFRAKDKAAIKALEKIKSGLI